MPVIRINRYRFATFGNAGQILLAVEHNGQIYRGTGPFYNAQPEDHMTSENEDALHINNIVRNALRGWDGIAVILDGVITVPLFYEVPDYVKSPFTHYKSTRGCDFATLIYLRPNVTIPKRLPWQFGEEIIISH